MRPPRFAAGAHSNTFTARQSMVFHASSVSMRHAGHFLEDEIPVLRYQVLAEAEVLVLAHELEPGADVDVAGGVEVVLRPERELPVARGAPDAGAFAHQARSGR